MRYEAIIKGKLTLAHYRFAFFSSLLVFLVIGMAPTLSA